MSHKFKINLDLWHINRISQIFFNIDMVDVYLYRGKMYKCLLNWKSVICPNLFLSLPRKIL